MLKTEKILNSYGLTFSEAEALLEVDVLSSLMKAKGNDKLALHVASLDGRIAEYLQTEDVKNILDANRKEAIADTSENDFDEDFGDVDVDFDILDASGFDVRITDLDDIDLDLDDVKEIIKPQAAPPVMTPAPKMDMANALIFQNISASNFFTQLVKMEVPQVDSDGALVFNSGKVLIRGLYESDFSRLGSMALSNADMVVEIVSMDTEAVVEYKDIFADGGMEKVDKEVLSFPREAVNKVFNTQQYLKNGAEVNTSFDAIKSILVKENSKARFDKSVLNFSVGKAVHPNMVVRSNFYITPKTLYGLANCDEFFSASVGGYRYITNYCEANDLKQLRIFEIGGSHLNVPFNNTRNDTITDSVVQDEFSPFSSKVGGIIQDTYTQNESLYEVGFTQILPKEIKYDKVDTLSEGAGYFVFSSPSSARTFYVPAVVYNYFKKFYGTDKVKAGTTTHSGLYTLYFVKDLDVQGFIMIEKKNAPSSSPARLLPTDPLEYAQKIVGENAVAFTDKVDIEDEKSIEFMGEVKSRPVVEETSFEEQILLFEQALEVMTVGEDDEEIAALQDEIARYMLEDDDEEQADEGIEESIEMVSEPEDELGQVAIANDQDILPTPSADDPVVEEIIEEEKEEVLDIDSDDFEIDIDIDDDEYDISDYYEKGGSLKNRFKGYDTMYAYAVDSNWTPNQLAEELKFMTNLQNKGDRELYDYLNNLSYMFPDKPISEFEKGGQTDDLGNPTDPLVLEKMEVFIANEIPKLDKETYFTHGMQRKEAKRRFYQKYEYGAYNPKFSFDFFAKGGEVSSVVNNLQKGDLLKIKFGSVASRDNEVSLKVRSRNKIRNGRIDKITFENVNNPDGVRFYAYERGNGVFSFAMGDLAISNIEIVSDYAKGGKIEEYEYYSADDFDIDPKEWDKKHITYGEKFFDNLIKIAETKDLEYYTNTYGYDKEDINLFVVYKPTQKGLWWYDTEWFHYENDRGNLKLLHPFAKDVLNQSNYAKGGQVKFDNDYYGYSAKVPYKGEYFLVEMGKNWNAPLKEVAVSKNMRIVPDEMAKRIYVKMLKNKPVTPPEYAKGGSVSYDKMNNVDSNEYRIIERAVRGRDVLLRTKGDKIFVIDERNDKIHEYDNSYNAKQKIEDFIDKLKSSYAKGGKTKEYIRKEELDKLQKEMSEQGYDKDGKPYGYDNLPFAKGGKTPLDKEFKFEKNFVIYVPSTSNVGDRISETELNKRVSEVEKLVADEFGGFTKTETDGGYKSQSGEIIEEDIVKVSVFSTDKAWEENEKSLVRAVKVWAKEWGQEAIGFEYEGDLYYIDATGKMAKGGKTYAEGGEIKHVAFGNNGEKKEFTLPKGANYIKPVGNTVSYRVKDEKGIKNISFDFDVFGSSTLEDAKQRGFYAEGGKIDTALEIAKKFVASMTDDDVANKVVETIYGSLDSLESDVKEQDALLMAKKDIESSRRFYEDILKDSLLS